jgi:hypothetical protein
MNLYDEYRQLTHDEKLRIAEGVSAAIQILIDYTNNLQEEPQQVRECESCGNGSWDMLSDSIYCKINLPRTCPSNNYSHWQPKEGAEK